MRRRARPLRVVLRFALSAAFLQRPALREQIPAPAATGRQRTATRDGAMTIKNIKPKRGAQRRIALFAAGAVCGALASPPVFAARPHDDCRRSLHLGALCPSDGARDDRSAPRIAQSQAVATGDAVRSDAGSAIGILDSIAHWQNCFSRSQTQDVDAALAACELVASEPGLLPSTRTRVERRRAAIQEFKARRSEKQQQDAGARN
jgi:hypothetical protein